MRWRRLSAPATSSADPARGVGISRVQRWRSDCTSRAVNRDPAEKARIRRPSDGSAAPVVRRRGIPGPGEADRRNAMKATTTMRVAAGGVAGAAALAVLGYAAWAGTSWTRFGHATRARAKEDGDT